MPRLRNTVTGVVVSCTDETAARLGRAWAPVDAPAKQIPAKNAPRKRTAKTADTEE